MKRIVLFAAGLTALLGGCASLQQQQQQNYAADDNVDYRKVAAIESAARGRGVEIHWLRYPQLKKAPADTAPALDEKSGT